ncbi:MAG TPA: sigma-70 family RNA polymerase sigma factor [Gaiellaceae bacterium]
MRTRSDADLVQAVASGDADALRELDRRHRRLARDRAFRVLRSSQLAEDAAQDAFVDIWRTARAFDPARASVRTWISILAHRRAVDLARREARRRLRDGTAETLPTDSYSAEDAVLLRLDRVRVRAALEGLSDNHRELLELAYYAGYSQSQLSRRFGIPLGTVKSRMFHGLRELRLALA